MNDLTNDIVHTRAAFETWRASQPGRRRIPTHLWNAAVALLDHYSLARVSRELRLNPKQLRQRNLSAARPLTPNAVSGLQFVEMHATDLGIRPATSRAETYSHLRSGEPSTRLIFERIDGSRLTLCLPASDWPHIEALCATFMRA